MAAVDCRRLLPVLVKGIIMVSARKAAQLNEVFDQRREIGFFIERWPKGVGNHNCWTVYDFSQDSKGKCVGTMWKANKPSRWFAQFTAKSYAQALIGEYGDPSSAASWLLNREVTPADLVGQDIVLE